MDNSKARCSAFDRAVNLLTFKDRTTHEIKHKLNEKGYSSEEIDETVEKLSYYGYLNDQNYTISYIKDNTSKKGKKLIVSELSKKGIDRDAVDKAYDEVDIDEVSAIEELMKRRFYSIDFGDDRAFRRVVGFFLRRGFSYENIKLVLKEYKKSEDIEIC